MKVNPKKSSPGSSSTSRKEHRAAQRRNRQRSQAIRVIAILSVVATLIFLIIAMSTNKQSGSVGPVEGVQSFQNPERGHTTEPVTYEQIPPVGGPHNPAWQNCGVYSQPIADVNGVHSLEHGAVWITYQPDLPADEVEKLQALTRQSGFRLLSPYTDLSSPIVISAWGYQLKLDQADDTRLIDFIQKYEQNPQGPEAGAPCTGALGQPE